MLSSYGRGGSGISIPICQKVWEAIPKLGMKKSGRIGIYPDLSQLIWPKKSGKVGIYLDSPRLWAQKLPRLFPNYLEIFKSRDGHIDPGPDLSKSRGGLPDPDPDPSRPDFCWDFIPLEISRPQLVLRARSDTRQTW